VDIISRKEWGARSPRSRQTTTWSRRTEFVVHYSEGPTTQTPRQIQNYHMDSNGWSDIGYNFLVDVKGRIYEGRSWLVVGAHAPNHNTSGIGVCFIGRDGDATDAAKKAIRWLYDEACRRKGGTLAKRGHRDVTATSCPGDELYRWVKAGMPAPGGAGSAEQEGDDPLLGLKVGDKGERVKALQEMIRAAGQGAYLDKNGGTDGIYGKGTAEALRRVRVSAGSKAAAEERDATARGERVDAWAFQQLHTAIARNQAGKALHKVD